MLWTFCGTLTSSQKAIHSISLVHCFSPLNGKFLLIVSEIPNFLQCSTYTPAPASSSTTWNFTLSNYFHILKIKLTWSFFFFLALVTWIKWNNTYFYEKLGIRGDQFFIRFSKDYCVNPYICLLPFIKPAKHHQGLSSVCGIARVVPYSLWVFLC